MKKITLNRVGAATDNLPAFKLGEPISDDNPLPVIAELPSGYEPGEPVSNTNPLPVTKDASLYNPGEPVTDDNPFYVGNGLADPIVLSKVDGYEMTVKVNSEQLLYWTLRQIVESLP